MLLCKQTAAFLLYFWHRSNSTSVYSVQPHEKCCNNYEHFQISPALTDNVKTFRSRICDYEAAKPSERGVVEL